MTKKQLEEEIQNITRQLIKKYQPEKIILFGSAARGEFEVDSDVDFGFATTGLNDQQTHFFPQICFHFQQAAEKAKEATQKIGDFVKEKLSIKI